MTEPLIKIESDGTYDGTKVFIHGVQVMFCRNLKLEASPHEFKASVELHNEKTDFQSEEIIIENGHVDNTVIAGSPVWVPLSLEVAKEALNQPRQPIKDSMTKEQRDKWGQPDPSYYNGKK